LVTLAWRKYVILGGLGLAMAIFVASFQAFPGYMDSDYYFAGGLQLAEGKGFSEPYIWNYLDDPAGIPHPSHSYWMPLSSILTALGMLLTGSTQYTSGRLAFIALAAVAPMVTARLAVSFDARDSTALLSGLLAVFSIFYAPFLPVTDNYGIYLVLGALFLLTVTWDSRWANLAMGIIAGAMSLARSDGVLWLLLGIIATLAQAGVTDRSPHAESKAVGARTRVFKSTWLRLGTLVGGYLLVVAPWLVRNLVIYGSARAPGADRLLWLTTYDEIFSFPAGVLTPQRWWNNGMQAVISVRAAALRWNLLNALAAQGGIFLVPFILVGAWNRRADLRVRLGVGGWLALLAVMTLAFPTVGARGGWFHAGAGIQPLWWCLAPLGLDSLVMAARRRQWFSPKASVIFGAAMIFVAAFMTAYVLWLRLVPGWGEGEDQYPRVDKRLVAAGARPEDVVMVRNPPGYFLMTGRRAIVVPYSDSAGILSAARKYGADFLLIDATGAAGPILTVYDDLRSQSFVYLGEEGDTRLFRVVP
jgi:hypothetical protein